MLFLCEIKVRRIHEIAKFCAFPEDAKKNIWPDIQCKYMCL